MTGVQSPFSDRGGTATAKGGANVSCRLMLQGCDQHPSPTPARPR
ncbi:hypothetical protein SNOG_10194 [Parastagonospora nodorum SN15]|uniref:Uncharacterized protein n=1 Tax=Phaeosphaeria nodorum (strain SN15 / ATCC MYA-4574 / FGSC 10173) TaxID=321614 RepID=Q0UDH0_PHANO|nr:hypothetical protein SNOG_10194 [Parastagonospora nodorum SN15]EAT82529.1 hypothetical protein SNOG_10194 [Parastagonospora nodorum SN15]